MKKSDAFEVEIVEGYIYCDVHGEIHEETTNPYDGPPTEYRDGKPVWLTERPVDYHGTVMDDHPKNWAIKHTTKLVPMGPECTPANWTSLYRSEGVYEGKVTL